jgi:hypothetical protein
MIRTLLILSILTSALFSTQVSAATATCQGRYKNVRLSFLAKGSLMNKNDGSGYVKVNNRIVAQFDGDYARINYLMRTFSIRNHRGDIVEGKLNNIRSGASTLTRMILPGEGIRLFNVPVDCDMI